MMAALADIEAAVEIEAPLARVWACLTEEGLVDAWLGCLQFRAEVGATFYMQLDMARRAAGDVAGATHCQIEAIEAPHRVRFSWFMPGTPKTYVEILLTAEGAGVTIARLRHSGWDAFDATQIGSVHQMLSGGWRSYVLPSLKRVAEG